MSNQNKQIKYITLKSRKEDDTVRKIEHFMRFPDRVLFFRPKMDEKLKKAWKNAESFEGPKPPNNAQEIGRVSSRKDGGLIFIFYEDEKGNFYYQSNRQKKFETEMTEKRKKKGRRMAVRLPVKSGKKPKK